jgi:hypothetical protein
LIFELAIEMRGLVWLRLVLVLFGMFTTQDWDWFRLFVGILQSDGKGISEGGSGAPLGCC